MDANHKIARNTLLLYFRMLVIMLVSLYTSRIILEQLGVEDFGIYSLVGGIVMVLSFLNNAMSLATQRFLNVEIGKGNVLAIKRIFSMAMTVHMCIVIIVLIVAETIGIWFLNYELNIPIHRLNAANWVYQFTIFSFCFSILQVPYNASIIAYEKMSYYAYISIIEALLKLGVVYLLIISPFDKLIFYSFLVLGLTILIWFCYKIYCTRIFEICRYKFTLDVRILKEMLSFSSWTLGGQLAVVSSNQGINFLLNIFCGVIVNAAMGIASQVLGALQSFVTSFQIAFRPQIIQNYAIDNKERLFKLIVETSKLSYFLMLIFAVPIVINMKEVLDIWLKNVPEYSVGFCRILIIHALFEAFAGPMWVAIHATGNIKKYQLFISLWYLFNLLLVYCLLKMDVLPQYVLLAIIVTDVFILITRIRFISALIGLSHKVFIENLFKYLLPVTFLSLPIPIVIKMKLVGLESVVWSVVGGEVLIIILIYLVGFSREEKEYVRNYVIKILEKR